jgi:hypothetical protein
MIGVFLDLKRAFETIDRSLLLRKFGRNGVRNKENVLGTSVHGEIES